MYPIKRDNHVEALSTILKAKIANSRNLNLNNRTVVILTEIGESERTAVSV